MRIKPPPTSVPDVAPRATPETLSDAASQAQLGPVDEKTALMIKVCEARQAASFEQKFSQLRDDHTAQRERYKALLREYRDRLDALKLDDLLKVLVGMFGGFLIRAFSEKGLGAFSDTWVTMSVFLLAISLCFLIVGAVRPSRRSREVDAELHELNEKKS